MAARPPFEAPPPIVPLAPVRAREDDLDRVPSLVAGSKRDFSAVPGSRAVPDVREGGGDIGTRHARGARACAHDAVEVDGHAKILTRNARPALDLERSRD